MDKDIFTLITREEERTKLFIDLYKSRGEILCKGQEDNLCRLRAYSYSDKTNSIECSCESPTALKNDEEYVGYFFLGGEKYYFQGKVQVKNNNYFLEIPKEIYRLQRRQNYRVKIPAGYAASFRILNINAQPTSLVAQLVDLSSQGCRATHHDKTIQLKLDDQIQGQLIIGNRGPLDLQGLIRHIAVDGKNPLARGQVFGIEFKPLSANLESQLFSLTLEIHKQIFRHT